MSIAITKHTLDVPGAQLYYEVQGAGPLLLILGLPMDSSGFAGIAPLLADDYTVVTYDPRGISNSTCDDPEEDATPELISDDVHQLLSALTDEPADVFGSSGGAITGLALTERHPEQVRALVAHEPPLVELLADRDQVRAGIDDVYRTYRRDGQDAAWPKFFAVSGMTLPPPDESTPPEPPSDEAIANGARMLGYCLRPTTRHRADIDALRVAATRIVVAGGSDSKSELAHRTTVALAERLDTAVVDFPGDHGGFMWQPEGFAHKLRDVLTTEA